MSTRWSSQAFAVLLGTLVVATTLTTAQAAGATTIRASVSSAGTEGDLGSYDGWVSANGRYVAFDSDATTLIPSDTNAASDVFVHDRQTGRTRLVSVASNGTRSNGSSFNPSLSANGRFIVYQSDGDNLVAHDTNNATDIFVWDRTTGKTRRVSLSSAGVEGNGASYDPAISDDGTVVVFHADATNLVSGDANGTTDVFARLLTTGKTRRVSLSSAGAEGNGGSYDAQISADGRSVVYQSVATNLVKHDDNGYADVFLFDLVTRVTRRVSVSSAGGQANGSSGRPTISAEGEHVAFESEASNLVGGDTNIVSDVFVRDLGAGRTRRVSVSSSGQQGDAASTEPSLSADGMIVAFVSLATNLLDTDANAVADIYVRNRSTGATRRVSLSASGAEANNSSTRPSISNDGTVVSFESDASNLVGQDLNVISDVFVRGVA